MVLGILMIFILYYIVIMIIIKIIQAVKRYQTINSTSDTQKLNDTTNNQSIIDSNTFDNTSINSKEIMDYKKYYRPKRYVITKNELNFYTVLLEVAKELNLMVFSQVSLYNILETKPNLDYKTKTIFFNKIASKSIDFVLVDKKDCRIKLCIELDDSTHRKEKRIERDNFINKLFKDLEIDLLRYPLYIEYYKDTLKKRIQENIKEHYYIN